MDHQKRCPECSAILPGSGNEELCPRCLLKLAMAPPTHAMASSSHFPTPSIDDLSRAFPSLVIESLIGQGGMGAVYRARQTGLDRVVALKILPPEVASRDGFAQRFEREARAMARLTHANIVTVYDSGRAGDYYYLMMEYIDGVNLREAIQTQQMTCEEALAIVPQICDALQYAHDEGIVHRDIKPENILLNSQGQIKIADFGLARMLDHNLLNPTLTASHQVMGTPRYMAPEQIEGTHAVDHRADIYSLGVVFYELLTGELPLGRFAAPSQQQGIDKRLDQVVYRTLEKKPDQRYQQVSELKTDVERITQHVHHHHWHDQRGYEYKSELTIFGLPWVHVATGVNPETGRKRVAKGFFAMGDYAVGVFSLGGCSMGIFSLGGVSAGLFSLGGVSLGLLIALGGLSLGTGLSCGGVTVGSMAFGGLSMGYAAVGGAAFGVHAVGGNANSAAQVRDFEQFMSTMPSVRVWLSGLFFSILAIVGAVLGCYVVALGSRRRDSDSYRVGMQPQPTATLQKPPVVDHWEHPHEQTANRGSWVLTCFIMSIVLAMPALMIVLIIVGLAFFMVAPSGEMKSRKEEVLRDSITFGSAFDMSASESPFVRGGDATATIDPGNSLDPAEVSGTTETSESLNKDWFPVQFDSQGIGIADKFAEELNLDPEERNLFNEKLRQTYETAQQLVDQARTIEVDSSRNNSFEFQFEGLDSEQMKQLETEWVQSWSNELSSQQVTKILEKMHRFPKPHIDTEVLDLDQLADCTAPALLQWGDQPARLLVWKGKAPQLTPQQNTWFYGWQLEVQGLTYTGQGSELPPQFSRLMDVELPNGATLRTFLQ